MSGRLRALEAPTKEQMEALAEEEGLSVQTTEPFGRDAAIAGIGQAPDFLSAAFDLEVGGLSEPVRIPRGWMKLSMPSQPVSRHRMLKAQSFG